jgi:hypothetical protein
VALSNHYLETLGFPSLGKRYEADGGNAAKFGKTLG